MDALKGFGIMVGSGGGEQKLPCPQCQGERKKHTHDRPLAVNVDRGVWLCHHCGWAGSVAKRSESIGSSSKFQLESGLPDWGVAFMHQRGIDPAVALKLGVGKGNVWMPGAGGKREVLAFAMWNGGELVNVKYRGEVKSFRQVKGGMRSPFNLDVARRYDTWIWTEGEMDVLALAMAGLDNVLSVPDGAPPEGARNIEGKMAWLASLQPDLAQVKRHVLALDQDGPGKRLEREMVRRLGEDLCWIVSWPEGVKDANDCLLAYGPQTLREIVEQAKVVSVSGLIHCHQVVGEMLAALEREENRGVAVGFEVLDQLYRPRLGEMTIVTGMPGSGKSEFLDQVAVNLATRYGWHFGFYSPENRPYASHFAKLAEKRGGKTWEVLVRENRAAEIIPWLDAHFVLIGGDDTEDWGVQGILGIVERCMRRFPLTGLVLDPWNEVDHNRQREVTETEHISRSLTILRRFARKHKIHLWLVAHPMKLDGRGSKTYPVPKPYDIAGSAHFFNKADNCLSVWRDVSSNRVEIHVQKIRFRQSGQPGVCILDYNRQTRCYSQSDVRKPISG
ncbi:MAG: toprim domain-containing protein [Magnetococcus sp. THC-1_WYH]